VTFGALILSGGNALRMDGQNKARLLLQERTFLSRLEEAVSGFDEKLLSTNDPALFSDSSFRCIPDRIPGRGPLEGIFCGLEACKSDALVVVACDMPLFSSALAHHLTGCFHGFDALVCRDRQGGLHPLCGVYSKACLPAAESLLAEGTFQVRRLLSRVNSGYLNLSDTPFPDQVLTNINTKAELMALINRNSPLLFSHDL